MTRSEAIEMLVNATYSEEWQGNEKLTTAHLMAIEALQTPPISQRSMYQAGYRQGREETLKGEQLDEWCTDCKEYDTEKKCCPRFNRVIREALNREPSEDGTLEVKVEDATKIGRVLISDDKHRGGLYYPDEDEPKGDDLIGRAEAIEAIELVDWYHQNSNKDMVSGANDDEHQAWYKADDVYKALEAVPPADRPRGEWIHSPNGIDRDFIWWVCSECGHKIFSETEKDRIEFHAYCGRCGADMRSE